MRLQFSRFVESDVAEIADYIGMDNPARAESFVEELWEEVRSVGKSPLQYRLRPEHGKDIRMAVVGRYVILFRILRKVVRIERVVHGGRDIPKLFP